MHRILVTCLAIALAAGPSRAGTENAGTTAGNFLSVGSGASVLSMGGATLGLGDDLHAAAWNPAALAHVDATAFAISHATLAEQSMQDHLAVGGRVGHGTTHWAATLLRQGDGSFDGRDASNNPTGSFDVSSMAAGLQFARPIGGALTAGLGASWLSDNLGDVQGTGFAFDAGLQARAGTFGFGLAARNIGGSMSYPSGSFDLPSVYGVGAAWSDAAHGLRLALDANFPHAYYNDVRMGGEWCWQEHVALRAGYRMELGAAAGEPLGGPSFGLGVGANGVWMDYAFLSGNADAQGRHRLGITLHPNALGGAMRRASEARTASGAPAEREAVAVAAPRVAPAPIAPAIAPVTVSATPMAVATPVSAPRVAPVSVAVVQASAPVTVAATPIVVPVAIDVASHLPPGASESQARERELVPSSPLVASRPVSVRPLDRSNPTGSIGDHWVEPAPIAVAAPAAPKPVAPAAVVVAAPVAIVAPAPKPVALVPVVVAAPVAIVAPAPKPVAPVPVVVTAPVAIAAPAPVAVVAPVAPVAPKPVAPSPMLAAKAASRPARAPRTHAAPAAEPAAPSVEPAVPQAPVTPVVTPTVVPATPDVAPASTPEATKPAKSSPWPTVSATLPSVQLASSSQRVAVVTVPPDAPSTAPITRAPAPAATPTSRPSFVLVAEGETLESIAKRWDTTVPALMMENNLVNLSVKHGKKLVLPPPQHR